MNARWYERIVVLLKGNRPAARYAEGARLRSQLIRHYREGRLEAAGQVARRLVNWQGKLLGEEHPDYARGVLNLARLDQQAGDSRNAPASARDTRLACRQAFSLRHRLTTEGEAIEPSSEVEASSTAASTWNSSGDEATKILDQVLALHHVAKDDFSPLLPCRHAAMLLRAEIVQGFRREEAERLLTCEHPLASLVAIAIRPDSLNDVRWAECYLAVRKEFGSAVARAAGRRKLAVGSTHCP